MQTKRKDEETKQKTEETEQTLEIDGEVTSVKIPKEGENLDMSKKDKKKQKSTSFPSKKFLIILSLCILLSGSAAGIGLFYLLKDNETASELLSSVTNNQEQEKTATYSPLTGLPLSDPALATAPTFCVQVPNGTDGARPQAGLNEAGVIFEAIAEAGITRFAAIFQNPSTPVIGPIRSLRMYYLNWDTPFDCTVTHAGGADDALAALKSGGYRDLTEDYTYMWRGKTGTSVNRRWNNLFTSSEHIKKFNQDKGYTSSNVKGFARKTPEDAESARIKDLVPNPLDIDTATSESVNAITPKVSKISFNFSSTANFSPVYTYDSDTNSYARSYASGAPHSVYNCKGDLGEATPELSCGDPVQLTSKVVIAMIVEERRASDNYHENITSLGSGKAYIFQNGNVIEGTWSKPDKASQISFKDASGEEISLVPGQTIISAVPTYGSVNYE